MAERPPIPPEILGAENKYGGLTEAQIAKAYPEILNFCAYLTKGDIELAKDITQKTFEKAIQSNFEERDKSKPTTWLIAIARNIFNDHRRRLRTKSYPDRNPENIVPIEELQEMGAKEQHLNVQNGAGFDKIYSDKKYIEALIAKANLAEIDKTILFLREVEGDSIEEIVRATGLNENTIKVKFFRIRQKLQKAAGKLDRKPKPKRS